MTEFESKWWSAEVPEDWIVEEDDISTSFYRPDGVGAIQISAVRKESGEVSQSDLERFVVEQYGSTDAFEPTSVGELEGLHRGWVEEDTAWRTWFLRSGQVLFFVTYNCGLEDRDAESEDVLAILESLSPKS